MLGKGGGVLAGIIRSTRYCYAIIALSIKGKSIAHSDMRSSGRQGSDYSEPQQTMALSMVIFVLVAILQASVAGPIVRRSTDNYPIELGDRPSETNSTILNQGKCKGFCGTVI